MIDKKKACPVGGTTEQAAEMAAFGEAAISCSHCTTAPAQSQVPLGADWTFCPVRVKVRVSDFLSVGKQNGQTLKQLREIFPGDGRSLRAQIERERRDTPILSGQSGYYLPACEDEIRRFCGSMRRRARAIWRSAANVERAAGLSRRDQEQIDGQEVLF